MNVLLHAILATHAQRQNANKKLEFPATVVAFIKILVVLA